MGGGYLELFAKFDLNNELCNLPSIGATLMADNEENIAKNSNLLRF